MALPAGLAGCAGASLQGTDEFPFVRYEAEPAEPPQPPPEPKPKVITRTEVKTVTKTETKKVCPSRAPIQLTQEDMTKLSQRLIMQIDQHNQEGAAAGCW